MIPQSRMEIQTVQHLVLASAGGTSVRTGVSYVRTSSEGVREVEDKQRKLHKAWNRIRCLTPWGALSFPPGRGGQTQEP